jgi:lactate dehydrogenase-like 2-hydroxyacid dehydrogenase
MAAGGGAQVRSAGLEAQNLERIAFATSAGVHAQPLAEYAVFARWAMGMVSEQTVLIVGLGSIGRATALKLKALGAFVIGTSRGNEPVEGVDQLIRTEDLAKVAAQVDQSSSPYPALLRPRG